MKTSKLCVWTAAGLPALLLTAALPSLADPASATAGPERSYTGTVTAVDPQGRTLEAKAVGFWFGRHFNLGENCAIALWNQPNATISGLHPGERVKVTYQDAHGVLVADSVRQVPMECTGMVKSVDPATHTLLLREGMVDRKIRIPDGCRIALHGDRPGTLADVAVGDRVTVTYESPPEGMTAREIAQTSNEYTGELTAVDLGQHTVKARAMFGSKKFNLADDCAVVVNGRPDGSLNELQLGRTYSFNYDDVNGVNVVTRIGAAHPNVETTSTFPQQMTAP